MSRPVPARHLNGALIVLLACAVAALAATPAHAAPRATHIVQLRPGVTLSEGASIVRGAGGRVADRLELIHGLAVRMPSGDRATLARDPRVAAISPNAGMRPSSTTLGGEAWSFDATRLATAYPWSVRAPAAWSSATGLGVGVAVIDTGIDGDLPDFASADGSSRVVASVMTNSAATTAADTYGHGTHVAGIIAGDGGRRPVSDPLAGRYIGIAPRADLISIKAGADDGTATVLDAIYGLQFAVEHISDFNIRVVNLSLESTHAESYRTDPLDAAVESAYFHGLVVVAAAGNHGATAEAADYAPGNDPFAITVGAVDDKGTAWRGDDTFTDWSSVGQTQDGFHKPEIGAPGAHIVSALAPDSAFASLCPTCVVDGQYIRAGGTSMAAPVVSGVAALMLERHPGWTPDQVKSTILANATDLYGSTDEVNARGAVGTDTPASGANAGIVPNDLVDAASGDLDYARSSWSRSSWSTAPDSLTAGWARSSWSCDCGTSDDGGAVDPTRSSWSRSSWSTKWGY
jgi:serine protease AprX